MVTGEHEVPLTGAYTSNKAHWRNNRLIYTRIFTALGVTASLAVFALYLESFGLSNSTIGFIFSIVSALTFFVHLFSTSILERITKTKIFLISSIIVLIAYISIWLSDTLTIFLIGFYVLFMFHTLKNLSFEILFRDHIKTKNFNRQEGRLMALRNVGAAAGPLLAGFILYWYKDFTLVYLLSAISFVIAITIFWRTRVKPKIKRRRHIDDNAFKNLFSYIKNPKLRIPYFMGMGTAMWWTFVHVYVPLFIINAGLSASTAGWFVAATIIPLILLEARVGATSTKYGFRNFFMIGFGGLFALCILLFFVTDIKFQLFLLVIGSIFGAFLGPNLHPYFFKQVRKKEEEKYYPIFGTSFNLGSFIGRFTVAWILLYFNSSFSYLIIAIFMAVFLGLASKIPRDQR